MRLFIFILSTFSFFSSINAQNMGYAPANVPTNSVFSPFKKAAREPISEIENAFQAKKITFSIGVGLYNLLNPFKGINGENGLIYSETAPIFVKLGYGLTDEYELGLNLNYTSGEGAWTVVNDVFLVQLPLYVNYDLSYSNFSALLSVKKHFRMTNRFDPYWAAAVGYRSFIYDLTVSSPNAENTFSALASLNSPFTFEFGVGARYYLTKNFAFYGEAGISRSPVQLGLSLQF
jgi:hypothetical protein